jgi:signal transduction histidine kinase
MRHRVRSFGGTFDIDAPPQGGTCIQARILLRDILKTPRPNLLTVAATVA